MYNLDALKNDLEKHHDIVLLLGPDILRLYCSDFLNKLGGRGEKIKPFDKKTKEFIYNKIKSNETKRQIGVSPISLDMFSEDFPDPTHEKDAQKLDDIKKLRIPISEKSYKRIEILVNKYNKENEENIQLDQNYKKILKESIALSEQQHSRVILFTDDVNLYKLSRVIEYKYPQLRIYPNDNKFTYNPFTPPEDNKRVNKTRHTVYKIIITIVAVTLALIGLISGVIDIIESDVVETTAPEVKNMVENLTATIGSTLISSPEVKNESGSTSINSNTSEIIIPDEPDISSKPPSPVIVPPPGVPTIHHVILKSGSSTSNCDTIPYCISPRTIHIKIGDSITWINEDAIEHNLRSGKYTDATVGQDWNFVIVPGGQTTMTFDKLEIVSYHSLTNPNMIGTIHVHVHKQ